ncbi:MAG: Ig-like domain-containing protein [Bacteroides sp.]|nr:Ig-like domain-containing protein [Bacteroides sp.]
MKTLFRRLGIVAGLAAALYSCASIGTLQGGPYDEDPPVFLKSSPTAGELHNTKKKLVLEFDEFIALSNASEKVVISPPQVQQPEITASSKKVIVKLNDTLKANTTYTIDFGDAIQDNNEGNPLEAFTFTFSTGDRLDTMAIAGTMLNAENLEPVKGMLVGLHANVADSAFTTLPFDRVGRTDSRGRFSIRGVAPGQYRIYGLQDADQNFAYSQPSEVIAFGDSLIIPTMEQRMRHDTVWVDSLTIDTIYHRGYTHFLPDDILLRCFHETNYTQRLARSERLTPKKFSFYFTAPADTLPLLKGLNFDEKDAFVIEQTTGRNDTLHYWIKDSLVYQMDTLRLSLSYLYTDSLKQLSPRTDTLNLVSKQRKKTEKELEKEREKREKELEKKRKRGDSDTIQTVFLPVEVYAPSSMDVYDYLTLTFEEPLTSIDENAIHLRHKVDTLWEDMTFELIRDSLDHKVYNIYPGVDWQFGESYTFEVDSVGIYGLYGLFTDKIKKDFTVKKQEDYGAIFFDVSGIDTPAFVELLDGQDKVLRTVPLVDGKADFYFLNPGKYCARLVSDTNGNGKWDTGLFAEKRQPEEVFYYWQVIELKANFELNQTWNIKDRPLDKQKPDDLKKQKPDEDKNKNKNRNRNNS